MQIHSKAQKVLIYYMTAFQNNIYFVFEFK